jgi:hypothetical protein
MIIAVREATVIPIQSDRTRMNSAGAERLRIRVFTGDKDTERAIMFETRVSGITQKPSGGAEKLLGL